MKYLKAKNISKFSISDDSFMVYGSGRAIMDSTGALRLPKGTTAQQPLTAGVRIPGGADGYIRYNTDGHLEAYISGSWRVVKTTGTDNIEKQTLGVGNGTETKFGPLNHILSPVEIDNVIVLVENVMQISITNYTLETDPSGYASGQYIVFSEIVPLGKAVTVYYGYV